MRSSISRSSLEDCLLWSPHSLCRVGCSPVWFHCHWQIERTVKEQNQWRSPQEPAWHGDWDHWVGWVDSKIAPVPGLQILQHTALPMCLENLTMQPTTSLESEGKPGSTTPKSTFSPKLKRSMALMSTETPVRAAKATLPSESP